MSATTLACMRFSSVGKYALRKPCQAMSGSSAAHTPKTIDSQNAGFPSSCTVDKPSRIAKYHCGRLNATSPNLLIIILEAVTHASKGSMKVWICSEMLLA